MVTITRDRYLHTDVNHPWNGGHPRDFYYPKGWLLSSRISTILRGRDHLVNFIPRNGASPRDGHHHSVMTIQGGIGHPLDLLVDFDYLWRVTFLLMVTIIGMVTTIGMVTILGMVDVFLPS